MEKEPEFYQNWEDNNHCLQAAVMIVLNTLDRETTWEEVNKITEYEKDLYSWVPRTVVALAERIPGTRLISGMDYQQFAERGEEYFREHSVARPEWFELQKKHASAGFQKEQKAAQVLVERDLIEQERSLISEDFESLLNWNLLIALVDSGRLAREDWSEGHFVVVYGQDNENFIIHDPGLPPQKAWKV